MVGPRADRSVFARTAGGTGSDRCANTGYLRVVLPHPFLSLACLNTDPRLPHPSLGAGPCAGSTRCLAVVIRAIRGAVAGLARYPRHHTIAGHSTPGRSPAGTATAAAVRWVRVSGETGGRLPAGLHRSRRPGSAGAFGSTKGACAVCWDGRSHTTSSRVRGSEPVSDGLGGAAPTRWFSRLLGSAAQPKVCRGQSRPGWIRFEAGHARSIRPSVPGAAVACDRIARRRDRAGSVGRGRLVRRCREGGLRQPHARDGPRTEHTGWPWPTRPNPMPTPAHTAPERYLPPIYATLRGAPNKTGGAPVTGPVSPWPTAPPSPHRPYVRSPTPRPPHRLLSWSPLADRPPPGWIGPQSAEHPMETVGQLAPVGPSPHPAITPPTGESEDEFVEAGRCIGAFASAYPGEPPVRTAARPVPR